MILNLTSETMTTAQIYDAASTIIEQKLSQLGGVGEVDIGGGANPAVRVELNPTALAHYGIGLEDVRAAIAASNGNVPKGQFTAGQPEAADLHQRPGVSSPTTTNPSSSPIATGRR